MSCWVQCGPKKWRVSSTPGPPPAEPPTPPTPVHLCHRAASGRPPPPWPSALWGGPHPAPGPGAAACTQRCLCPHAAPCAGKPTPALPAGTSSRVTFSAFLTFSAPLRSWGLSSRRGEGWGSAGLSELIWAGGSQPRAGLNGSEEGGLSLGGGGGGYTLTLNRKIKRVRGAQREALPCKRSPACVL